MKSVQKSNRGSHQAACGKPLHLVLIAALSLTLTGNPALAETAEVKKPQMGFKSAASNEERRAVFGFTKLILDDLSDTGFKVGANAGENSIWLYIYGVNDSAIWPKVAERLAEEKKKQGWRTIYIQFFEKEVWEDLGNGNSRRGEERLLKAFLLE
ncbi:hypothetical protein [Verrucomicrobium sp. BvORR106]|uniref:hypothetical protein n=1 Tax=Verrucomicrobium sp. BvORR106 TaxID=1403819 RepID=UPI002240FEF3|nr:hypothetical protein [Verrucomicrobium sp. BvORR106]